MQNGLSSSGAGSDVEAVRRSPTGRALHIFLSRPDSQVILGLTVHYWLTATRNEPEKSPNSPRTSELGQKSPSGPRITNMRQSGKLGKFIAVPLAKRRPEGARPAQSALDHRSDPARTIGPRRVTKPSRRRARSKASSSGILNTPRLPTALKIVVEARKGDFSVLRPQCRQPSLSSSTRKPSSMRGRDVAGRARRAGATAAAGLRAFPGTIRMVLADPTGIGAGGAFHRGPRSKRGAGLGGVSTQTGRGRSASSDGSQPEPTAAGTLGSYCPNRSWPGGISFR
ncbi:hypothetical protein SAMN05192541_109284 [Bradyrhizobium arachidis]|nr:hypothetical protein SAMN05192541_109284 [Bradyrhizobium arachidis]